MKKIHKYANRLSIFATILAVSLGSTAQDADSLPPTQMIDVGGHKLEALVHGKGSPTVVIDAGMIGGMELWRPLQARISQHTQTLSYERAGLGESEEGPEPRSALQIAKELRELLTNAGASPPFVVVGHSAGGMFIRVFAATYPNEIAGIVLVDPATAAVYEHMERTSPARWADYVNEVRQQYNPGPGWYGQWSVLQLSMEQARNSWPLPEVPTIVLTALQPIPGEWPLDSPENMAVWLQSHVELLDHIPHAEHVVLPDANHGSIANEDVLGDSILRVINLANGQSRLSQ